MEGGGLDPDDDRLAQRLIARDPGAWEAFLAEYGGLLAAACRWTLFHAGAPSDPSSVSDASAEVVRALLEDDARLLRRHRPGTPLGAYLRVIARSRTLNALPRNRAFSLLEDRDAPLDEGADAALQAAERAARLREALFRLDPKDREALRLFHLEGLPYAEISRRTGIPQGALGMALTRARERLRALLGGNFLETP